MSYFGIPIRNGASVGLGSIISLLSGSRSAPTLSFNFLSGSLDSQITFTRASTGTYFDSAGVLQTAAINAPRFDYNPSTLAAQGLLIEELRTNLLTYSEDFNNAAWLKTDITVTADNTTAPNGTTTADLITEGTAGTAFTTRAASPTVAAGATVTGSFFIKRSSVVQWVRVRVANSAATNGGNVWFDIQNGVLGNQTNLGSGTATSGTITAINNGWYRITAITTLTAGDTTASMGVCSASANGSTTRVNSSVYWAWGAQLEAGAFPTSYIPTTTAAATRAADYAVITTLAPWYNATASTIYTEFRAALTTAAGVTTSLNDATANNRVTTFVSSSSFSAGRNTGGAGVVFAPSTAYAPTTAVNKVALAIADLNTAICGNGGTVVTSAVYNVPTVTQLELGNQLTAGYLNGHIRTVTYYPSRLSNAQLRALTV